MNSSILLLRRLGADKILHSGTTLLKHLVGVNECLNYLNETPALQRAGLFHSVYGTDSYKKPIISISERHILIDEIGKQSETSVYQYCATSSTSIINGLKGNCPVYCENFKKNPFLLSDQEFKELLVLHFANFWEQRRRNYSSQKPINKQLWKEISSHVGDKAEEILHSLILSEYS